MWTGNVGCVAYSRARWPHRESSLRAKRVCCRTTTRGWRMTSGPSWTTSQKSLRQQRYIYTPSSPFCSLFLYHFLSLCSFLWAVCLLFSMKDILVSGSLTSCHVLSRDILSLCSKYLSKCALFSVHCFLSPDRGWDTGVPSNPGRAGPLWDARQSSQHCEYKFSFPE